MSKPLRMYSDYFGIRENAFAITPDPRYLFLSEHHREALAHLMFGTEEGGGFVQLTGEVGTGKTTICRAFLEQLPENVDVALLLNPPESGRELLLAIISELRLPEPGRDAPVREMVDLLNEHLLEAHAAGCRTVVIIDEAQNLLPDVLEQVRLLTNLETPTHKLLQVFLIGQPELRQKLEQPALRQVAQRITARYHLEPLSLAETRGYIQHRLAVAGCRQGLFTPAAIKQIYLQSQGIPRVINILCDRALLGAFATDSPEVDAAIVRYAAREWRGGSARRWLSFPLTRKAIPVAVAGILFAAAVGGAGISSMQSDERLTSLARTGGMAIGDFVRQTPPRPDGTAPEPDQAPGDKNGVRNSVPAAAANTEAAPTSVIRAEPVVQPVTPPHPHPTPATTTTNAVPQPAPDTVEAVETISVQRALQSGMPVAMQALLASWDIRRESVQRPTLCARAVSHGLRCLRDSGGWDELRAYNRPALLTLNRHNEEEAYLTLVGMNKEHALVATVDGPRQVPYRELDAYWTGEFVLLWRPPLAGISLIGSDSAEWAVRWLREALERIDGQETAGMADAQGLEQRLRSFQQSQGLVADGVAGPRTFIHLNTLISERKFPVLLAAPRNT